jgi:transposase InsO family protein
MVKFFKHFKASTELAFDAKIQAFRSDRGGEFLSLMLTEILKDVAMTQAYTPHQNGLSECKNRTLLEKTCAMVFDVQTLRFLWSEVVNAANYLTN